MYFGAPDSFASKVFALGSDDWLVYDWVEICKDKSAWEKIAISPATIRRCADAH